MAALPRSTGGTPATPLALCGPDSSPSTLLGRAASFTSQWAHTVLYGGATCVRAGARSCTIMLPSTIAVIGGWQRRRRRELEEATSRGL